MKYLISATFTVEAEDEDEAKHLIGQFLASAFVGESCEIEDYSVEDVLETYDKEGNIYLRGDN